MPNKKFPPNTTISTSEWRREVERIHTDILSIALTLTACQTKRQLEAWCSENIWHIGRDGAALLNLYVDAVEKAAEGMAYLPIEDEPGPASA